MSNLRQLSILFIFCAASTAFSQSSNIGLEGKNWIISATQFDDSSYVVSCQHSSRPMKVVVFDKNGNQTASKTLGKNEDWTFSERPFKRYEGGLMVPMIDKKKKIGYCLFGKDGELAVTVINEKLEIQTVVAENPIYKKFDGLYEYTAPITEFDPEGNPVWAITQNRMGILLVKYNIANNKLEHKYLEHEGYSNVVRGYDYISASVIGYHNEKVWYAQITDRGHKKENGILTLFSIDKNFNVKSEKEIKLKKPVKDIAMMVKSVNQLSAGNVDNMFFTLHSISANNGGPVKQLWFFSFDGEEVRTVSWENNSGSSFYHVDMMATETAEEQARFVIGDEYGNAIAWDIDFNNEVVENISAIQGLAQDEDPKTVDNQIDIWIYSILLFEKLLSEDFKAEVGNFKVQGNTPLIFRGIDSNFFLIKGDYKVETTGYTPQF